ncbi:alkaline phosphatase D family protein [Pareuzebyella sediminis]|uniref:alkaline phosphatase D family protein n=1 Tax=Pareuzebyella sediminis TaxID=2607998 RepID=UPI0011EC19AC|nr:alkaline phosphatase D family protein [Pareuzebyella sediminis]
MKRRDYLKKIVYGSAIPCITPSLWARTDSGLWPYKTGVVFKSNWHNWPDTKWCGPEYWGNRLQDWEIKNGEVVCQVTDSNRSLHLLPVQIPETQIGFTVSIGIRTLNKVSATLEDGCLGIRLGGKGPTEDYRSAAVFGRGLDIGLLPSGKLKIGDAQIETGLNGLPEGFGLTVEAIARPKAETYELIVSITDLNSDQLLVQKHKNAASDQIKGNLALIADLKAENNTGSEIPSASFSSWSITSEELNSNAENTFGPVCFAQYTLHRKKLKLTAQLAPIEAIDNHSVTLQTKVNGQWKSMKTDKIDHPGRAVNFTLQNWERNEDIPYRLVVELPLRNKNEHYYYEGTIAKEPKEKETLKAAVFSCNFDYGFPDSDIVENMSKLEPDVILFLGDQFYEATGGFGVTFRGHFDKTCLDYLRKWYMFGWSYRELFRHKPCAIIPDDHDVFHGNVWGEEGKKADVSQGFGAPAQDSGGYKMPAEWVNMVQFTQTSHLPDAVDPTPVKQGIGVYYTHWNYAGISFAILEDRKFKSAPKHVLPKEAEVFNGWILNDEFDIKKYKHIKADLLGERQEHFLEEWVTDWSEGTEIKVVLSQTNFATVATLPKEAKTGEVIPSLYIPEKGEYIEGDRPTVDMDSNGWPSAKRDLAVEIIRKGFAFHIAGDQHLASFVQYGLQEHGDSGFAFAGPALNNIWPRRFWPPTKSHEHSYENPAYTGNHIDGFGNKMTVRAVANPHNVHKEPEILHNRAVGYGLVTFNKKDRTIKTECWPRFVDPKIQGNQYPGWPITIRQEENYGRKAIAWLPEILVEGKHRPVVKVFSYDKKLVHAIRIKGNSYRPKVFAKGRYTIIVQIPETGFVKKFENVRAKTNRTRTIQIKTDGVPAQTFFNRP